MLPLKSFAPAFPGLQLQAELRRARAGILALRFELRGPLSTLNLPTPTVQGERVEGLWKHSCFEIFIAPYGRSEYGEWNFSPGGQWCCYMFSDYRKRSEPRQNIEQRAPQAWRCARPSSELLALSCEIADPWPEISLEVSLNAVLEQRDGQLTYWALSHPGREPDFHARAAFSHKVY